MVSKYFIVFATIICFIAFAMAEESPHDDADVGERCIDAINKTRVWLIVLMVIPSLLNVVSVILLIFSMVLIRRLKSVVEAISSSTHWLTRTAIRVGLGPTAKKALIEYAKGKPEFKRLLG